MKHVTGMDVRNLLQEPSGKVRSMLASKIALDYRYGNFSEKEVAIANDIFRMLVKDIEKRVRQAIAEQLCFSPHVPYDIIAKLASDDVDVALPVLEFSRILNDDDLIKIIQSTEEVSKQRAIARRDNISAKLSSVLMETESISVMGDLFRNRGAIVTDQSILSVWSSITGNGELMETLVERGGLSLAVVEKLIHAVSDDMKHRLIKEYKIASPLAGKAASDAREWETLGVVAANVNINPDDDEQIEDLVDQLQTTGRLTQSLIIRALCTGAIPLFEAGIARLAGVPRVNARILMSDPGALGFYAIYRAACMPEAFEEAMRVLLRISLEETGFGTHKPDDLRKVIIDRIFKEGYHRSVENMEYLLSIIGGKIARDSFN